MKAALERLANAFDGFAGEIRDLVEDMPQGAGVCADLGAGGGENVDDGFVDRAVDRGNGIDDETVITMKSGDLRKVVDAYRKLVRYARNGRIPTQDERLKLHQNVKAVKHLIRKPRR